MAPRRPVTALDHSATIPVGADAEGAGALSAAEPRIGAQAEDSAPIAGGTGEVQAAASTAGDTGEVQTAASTASDTGEVQPATPSGGEAKLATKHKHPWLEFHKANYSRAGGTGGGVCGRHQTCQDGGCDQGDGETVAGQGGVRARRIPGGRGMPDGRGLTSDTRGNGRSSAPCGPPCITCLDYIFVCRSTTG